MNESDDPKQPPPPRDDSGALGAQLEVVEENLRFVLGPTDGIAFEIDAEGRYLGIWTRSEELLIVPRERALGRTMTEVLGPQAAAPFMERLQRTLSTGQHDHFEYTLEVAGGVRWFSADAVRSPQRPTVIFLMRDITQRKILEQRMLLADRLAAMGTLAAGVAHEVNNPLSYITSNLNFIKDGLLAIQSALRATGDAPDIPQAKRTLEDCADALADAQEGTTRLRQLVGDLKTFARGRDESMGSVDVRRALEASLSIALREIRFRATLVKHLEDVPPVRGNEAHLGQVFLNLLLNAAQAIPEGAPEKNRVEVRLYSQEGQIVVEIQDTGAGIPPEMQERVFDPFFSTKPTGAGTGLGLSTSHGIITGMGGDISVESTMGQGTRFRVRLPAASPLAAQPPSGQTDPTTR
jgi:two-component system NtrC family sensor kinase